MSTDTNIKTLIFNKLTQEQYNNADRVPTEFYLTPDTSIDSSEKGAANGVASLDTNGKVPTEQIPVAKVSALGVVKPDGTTITVTKDGTISAAVSGEGVATKADLQDKVNKTGDTMSGTLNISGTNEVRFGTDDDYYYVQRAGNGQLSIFNKNNKGLFLQKEEAHAPSYWDGTKGFRLLTTADLQNLDYVVESYKDDQGNWYRKYKSGWLEQGGVATSNTVTLLKPMENANYSVYMSQSYNAEGYSAYSAQPHNRNTTSFSYFQYQGYFNAFWYVCGKGAN